MVRQTLHAQTGQVRGLERAARIPIICSQLRMLCGLDRYLERCLNLWHAILLTIAPVRDCVSEYLKAVSTKMSPQVSGRQYKEVRHPPLSYATIDGLFA